MHIAHLLEAASACALLLGEQFGAKYLHQQMRQLVLKRQLQALNGVDTLEARVQVGLFVVLEQVGHDGLTDGESVRATMRTAAFAVTGRIRALVAVPKPHVNVATLELAAQHVVEKPAIVQLQQEGEIRNVPLTCVEAVSGCQMLPELIANGIAQGRNQGGRQRRAHQELAQVTDINGRHCMCRRRLWQG